VVPKQHDEQLPHRDRQLGEVRQGDDGERAAG